MQDAVTKEEAAHLLGFYSYNQVYRIEAGKARVCPRTERLLLLWKRFGLTVLKAAQP
jgi:hypothetical protein